MMKFDIETLLISAGILLLIISFISIKIVLKSKKNTKNSNNKIGNVNGNVNIGDKK